MPKNIQDMIKQYKKIAIIKNLGYIKLDYEGSGRAVFPLNLNFKPSLVIVEVFYQFDRKFGSANSNINVSLETASGCKLSSDTAFLWINKFNQNEIDIQNKKSSDYGGTLKISSVIAIE